MRFLRTLIFFVFSLTGLSVSQITVSDNQYSDVEIFFDNFDKDNTRLNHELAVSAWNAIMDPSNMDKQIELENIADEKLQFVNKVCDQMFLIGGRMNNVQQRMYQLTCFGPKFDNLQEQKHLLETSSLIQYIYTSTKICIPSNVDLCSDASLLWNVTYVEMIDGLRQLYFNGRDKIEFFDAPEGLVRNLKCYSGEPQLEKFMEDDFSSIHADSSACEKNRDKINFWIWEVWRQSIGPKIKELYPKLIKLLNKGAINAGFANIGDIWKQEMEIDDVEVTMRNLLNDIQPFYNMLHAFVKSILEHKLKLKFNRFIPAHFLGWNVNWHHLLRDYIEPLTFSDKWNADEALKSQQWSSENVIKRCEDFYMSMGLSKMSQLFWDKSYFSYDINMSCHGTAANMYAQNDYRMIVCGCVKLYDFYVIIHEMGHVEQYMLAEDQPAVFRAGNSVIQETIGDSIFLAFMNPTHLHRLQLINDANLFPSRNNNFDLHQLMTIALMKIPELPFGYVLEKFRYDLFAERIDVENSNNYFWELTRKYQKVSPPNAEIDRGHLFDVTAKFHFAANVPYAKYFFANILQYQILQGLCKATVYGKIMANETLHIPLHKCDIYGSKRAGKILKKALGRGSEMSFKAILKTLTGTSKISANALLEYYKPLIDWLRNFLEARNIQY